MAERQDEVKILLVDDNPKNLIALSAILGRPDYDLITATSGEETLRLLLREEIAVVLLDVMMPDMDGFEVAAAMRQVERTKHIPIIFVTAIAKDLKDFYKAYSVGAVDYILKPIDPAVVKAKVSVFVDLFRKAKKIRDQAEVILKSERAQAVQREQAARHRAEKAEKRYARLVHFLDHAIVWEADCNLSHFSFLSETMETLLGYSRQDWLERPNSFLNCIPKEDLPVLKATLQKINDGRGSDDLGERCEHRIICMDGTERWFHTGMSSFKNNGNPARSIRGLSVDITPLKSIEHKLHEAVRTREEIVAIVAHDLKNLLASVGLSTHVLLKFSKEKGDPLFEKYADRLQRGINRAIKFTEDILDISKIEAGKFSIEPESVDLESLISEMTETFGPLAAESEIKIEMEHDLESLRVFCDPGAMGQVFSNLITNAIKFSNRQGSIHIKAKKLESSFICFSVTNFGKGITPAEIPHLFKPFWKSGKQQKEGTGLGLYIVKGIIESHQGQIWVESTENDGTTFFFTVPTKKIVKKTEKVA